MESKQKFVRFVKSCSSYKARETACSTQNLFHCKQMICIDPNQIYVLSIEGRNLQPKATESFTICSCIAVCTRLTVGIVPWLCVTVWWQCTKAA